MKHLFFTALMLFALTACNSSSDSKKDNNATGNGGSEKMQDVTDYSLCNQPAKSPQSIEGTWQKIQASENFQIAFTFQINRDATRFTNDCRTGGRSLRATVTAISEYNATSFTIKSEDTAHQEINEPNFRMNCDASIKKSTINYRFKGSCLVLSQNDQEMTLVPVQN